VLGSFHGFEDPMYTGSLPVGVSNTFVLPPRRSFSPLSELCDDSKLMTETALREKLL
jgi:hypothetical protein